MKAHFFALFILFAWLAQPHRAIAVEVTLAWNPSSSANAIGYNIYYGTTSSNCINKISVGNATMATISNLTAGITYYFAATTLDQRGDESGFSEEASFIIPGVLTLSSGTNSAAAVIIKFPVAPGQWYEVQATSDFQSWTTIIQTDTQTTNAWVQFSDPDNNTYGQRFYRLALH